MKPLLLAVSVVTLVVGLSGCWHPGHRRGEWRDRGGHGDRGDRGDRSERDCWMRDGHRYCRDDG